MDILRFGIIGCGNMGSGHLKNFASGKIKNVEVTAICDINDEKLAAAKKIIGDNVKTYTDYKVMFEEKVCDAVIIATPHYLHPVIGIDAFNADLHVISEKPIGVYANKVYELYEVAKKSDKLFGVMFNQRTNPLFQKMREIVQGGELGELKRLVWIITDWYRTQSYYNSGGWRATWEGEGGGVLLNQCPHQLDLWQWIFGMPEKITAHCYEGKYHDIEVEDDVTAFAEYANGATATFISTTGECPGTNRLEISGDKGKLVAENGKLTWVKNAVPEREWCYTCPSGFKKADTTTEVLEFPRDENKLYDHSAIVQNFANAVLFGEPLLASGFEAINGLQLSNAMFLSSWTGKPVEVPCDGDLFYELLTKKIEGSTYKKTAVETTEDISGTYGNTNK